MRVIIEDCDDPNIADRMKGYDDILGQFEHRIYELIAVNLYLCAVPMSIVTR